MSPLDVHYCVFVYRYVCIYYVCIYIYIHIQSAYTEFVLAILDICGYFSEVPDLGNWSNMAKIDDFT